MFLCTDGMRAGILFFQVSNFLHHVWWTSLCVLRKTKLNIEGAVVIFAIIFVPEHVLPSKPFAHSHENESPLLVHVPPFSHGDDSHGSESKSRERILLLYIRNGISYWVKQFGVSKVHCIKWTNVIDCNIWRLEFFYTDLADAQMGNWTKSNGKK